MPRHASATLPPSQLAVLRSLAKGARPFSNTSATVVVLQRRGLIERVTVATDRSERWGLTAAGRRAIEDTRGN